MIGSSTISTPGSPSNAEAIPSSCPIPSEKSPARRCATSVNPLPRAPRRLALAGSRSSPRARSGDCARCDPDARRSHPATRRPRAKEPQFAVAASADGDPAGGRSVQPHDHAHGRRLAASIRAEKAGDLAGRNRETQIVDRQRRAVALAQLAGLDHDAGPAASDDTARPRDPHEIAIFMEPPGGVISRHRRRRDVRVNSA